jgi:hypothetical protein
VPLVAGIPGSGGHVIQDIQEPLIQKQGDVA